MTFWSTVINRLPAVHREAFAGASISARRSSPQAANSRCLAGFLFCRQRSWIQPFAALLRPDCSATSSVTETHLSFACLILLDGFGRGIGRQNLLIPTATDQNVPGSTSGDSTVRPAVHCLSSDNGLMLPWGLPLSGLRTPAGAVCGLVPASLIGRRPFRFRRLSALELQQRSPVLPEPRWFTGPEPVSPPALQRFQRPMPCSSGMGESPPDELPV